MPDALDHDGLVQATSLQQSQRRGGTWRTLTSLVVRMPWTWPVASVATSLVLLVWWVGRSGPTGMDLVSRCCTYYAGLGWEQTAVRLVPSLASPALNLPVWGAALQVAVVFGVGQAALGWRRTVAVALLGHLAASLVARVVIVSQAASGELTHFLWVRDTGPSAATVAVAVYVALRLRRTALAFGVIVVVLGELAWRPDLSAWEHLVAAAVSLLVAGVGTVRLREGWTPDDLRRRRSATAGVPLSQLTDGC